MRDASRVSLPEHASACRCGRIEQIQAEASAYDSMKTGNELTNLGDILDEATKG